MQRVKIFKGVENELPELEQQINSWLVETGARVLHVFGNIAPQTMPADVKGHGLSKSEFAPSDVLVVVLADVPGK